MMNEQGNKGPPYLTPLEEEKKLSTLPLITREYQ